MSDVFRMIHDMDPAVTASLSGMAVVWGWAFLSIVARVGGLVAMSPLFGKRGVPLSMRVGLVVCVAMVVTPVLVSLGTFVLPADAGDACVRLGGEAVVGALLGFGVSFVFAGLKLAGEMIDQQAGAAVAEVFDPQSGGTATMSGQLLTIVGTLAFLSIAGDGHLRIIAAVLDSFATITPEVVWSGDGVVRLMGALGTHSLTLALQVAAPVLAAGAIASWGVSSLTRGGSQSPLATTVLGLPLRVAASLLILMLCLSGMTEAFLDSLDGVLAGFSSVLAKD